MKICTKCKIEKELSEFSKNNRNKDKLCYNCKDCRNKSGQIYRHNNKDKIRKRNKIYLENNKEKVAKQHKKYRDNNKVRIFEQNKKYNVKHREERKTYNKKSWLENKEYYKNYRLENKERIRKYKNNYCVQRRKTDIEYKILCNLRGRLSHVIENNSKSASTTELLGCTVKFLKSYLQNKFTKNMTFDNYGKWHIDHIKPCDSFDLSKESEQRKCFHYSNLQPLWELENLKKSNKY